MLKKLTIGTAFGLAVKAGSNAQSTKAMRDINREAPVQCSKTITIQANGEKVWSVLTDIDHWATWQKDISNPNLKGRLRPETPFTWKTGRAKIHSTLHTVEPNRYLGWTDKSFGMYVIHNWTLIEEDGLTTVAVEESMEGLLAGIFRKPFNSKLEKGMQTWLDLLKRECEK